MFERVEFKILIYEILFSKENVVVQIGSCGIIEFDKLEFVGVNDENFIYDWWHYGSWKNNCVPTAQTGFTE